MKFSLEIGETEKHRVECQTSPLLGLFVIKIDNVERAKTRHVVFAPRRQRYSFDVGVHERLQLTVEKMRGIFSGETHRVFVNGRLIRCYSAGKDIPAVEAKEVQAVPA